MDLFKKYINVILLIFAVFSAEITMASSNPVVPESDCGVSAGVVKLFDGEICEQDISFRMIYQLFPTVIENFVFPIINPEYLTLVPQLEQQNLYIYQTQEIIIFEIFKSTTKISFFIVSVFVLWHFLFLGLIRSANDGSFLGKSWKTSSVLTKYGVLIVLLLPVSDTGLLAIHVILLSILIIGIYFANYFWGVYLNYLQVGEDAIDISTVEDSVTDQKMEKDAEFKKNMLLYNHNYFFAYSYAKELSLIELCKQRTEKLFVLGTLPFMTDNNIGDYKNCLVDDSEIATWSGDYIYSGSKNVLNRGFAHYKNELNGTDITGSSIPDITYNTASNISFGNKDFAQCQSVDNNAYSSFSYNCGEIKISSPSIPEGNIKIAILNSNFYTEYTSASNAVMSSAEPFSDIENSWNSISNSIDTLFSNDGVLNAYKHNQSMIKKNVSYFFHRLLMNDALIGNANYTSVPHHSSEMPNYTKQPNFNLSISSYMKEAKTIARSIEKIGCLKNPAYYNNAKKAKKLIESYQNNSSESVSDYNTTCLDVNTLEPIGIDPKIYLKDDPTGEILSVKLEDEIVASIDEGRKTLTSLINTIQVKREAVEKSYYLSIINSPSNDLVNRLRKEGWAISGGYMLKLLSEKEMDNKLRTALQNSSVAKRAELSTKMLPDLNLKQIIKEDDADFLKDWMDLTSPAALILDDSALKPSRKDLKYVDATQFIDQNITSSMANADFESVGREGILNMIFSTRIADQVKSVVGIGPDGELSMDQISECIRPDEDSDNQCPMNLTNPIMEITKLGHGIISISTAILTLAITVAIIEAGLVHYQKIQYKNLTDVKGKNEDILNDDNASKRKEGKERSIMSKTASKLDALMRSINFILEALIGFAVFLLTVGFTLAYVIPLIPFVAFTIAFISWIVISLEILVIAPIWLSFLFRIEDSNRPSTELYMAGFNFVMQMLFRPALIVISITIGWALFNVIFMIINFSMATFIQVFKDTDSLIGFLYSILILIAYALVIYIAIKQIFDLMIMLPNKIFTKIGVQPMDASFESNAKNTLSNFTMAGIGGSKLLGNAIGKNLEGSRKSRDKMKEDYQDKIKEMKRSEMKQKDEDAENKTEEKGDIKDEDNR